MRRWYDCGSTHVQQTGDRSITSQFDKDASEVFTIEQWTDGMKPDQDSLAEAQTDQVQWLRDGAAGRFVHDPLSC